MEWKPIKGFEQYEVSNTGHIRRGATIKKFTMNTKGYFRTLLGHSKKVLVHRVVAEHFIPNLENKPQVNHKDGNKTNNHYSNLEWVTASENMRHAYTTGLNVVLIRGEAKPDAKLTEQAVKEMRIRYVKGSKKDGAGQMAREYGVSIMTVLAIVKNQKWKHVEL